jgi:hypothetical protein
VSDCSIWRSKDGIAYRETVVFGKFIQVYFSCLLTAILYFVKLEIFEVIYMHDALKTQLKKLASVQ